MRPATGSRGSALGKGRVVQLLTVTQRRQNSYTPYRLCYKGVVSPNTPFFNERARLRRPTIHVAATGPARRAAFLPRRGARRALEAASATAREGRRPRLANAAFLHWSITGRITEPVTPNLVLMFLLAQNCHTLLARKLTGLLLTRQ